MFGYPFPARGDIQYASWTTTATRLSRDIAIHLLGGLQYMENCISLVRWVTHALLAHAIARLQTAASLATPPHGSLEQLPKAGRILVGK